VKREAHPKAYDWAIMCGYTHGEIADCWDSHIIGLYNAHADLRATGKLPASAITESIERLEDYAPSILAETNYMESFLEIIEKMKCPIDRSEAYDEAYRAGLIPKQHVRRTTDNDGNLVREKAMVYYGETFEEALARESAAE